MIHCCRQWNELVRRAMQSKASVSSDLWPLPATPICCSAASPEFHSIKPLRLHRDSLRGGALALTASIAASIASASPRNRRLPGTPSSDTSYTIGTPVGRFNPTISSSEIPSICLISAGRVAMGDDQDPLPIQQLRSDDVVPVGHGPVHRVLEGFAAGDLVAGEQCRIVDRGRASRGRRWTLPGVACRSSASRWTRTCSSPCSSTVSLLLRFSACRAVR